MIRTGKNRLAFPISEQKRKVVNLNILDRHLYKPYIIKKIAKVQNSVYSRNRLSQVIQKKKIKKKKKRKNEK